MKDEIKNMKRRLIVSFIFLIPLFYISMGHMMGLPLPHILHGNANALSFAFTQFLLTLPIIYINRKYYQVGYKTLLRGAPNMDSLIAIGSTAALVYGVVAIYMIGWGLGHGDADIVSRYSMDLYFESAGMILTLITLGKFLETRSKGKTSEAITKLMDLAPKTAVVERDGVETEVPVEQVTVGDLIVVRPAKASRSTASWSRAVPRSTNRPSRARASRWKSTWATALWPRPSIKLAGLNSAPPRSARTRRSRRFIRLVEDAANSKAPIAKLADRVSGHFCTGCHRHRGAGGHRLVGARIFGGIRVVDRHRGAGHLLPVRAWPGNAGRHHGRYRQGRGKRHPDQVGGIA